MRTDLTVEFGGVPVRGVVTVGALDEMIGERTWQRFTMDLDSGDPRLVRDVLVAALKAAGDLKPLAVVAEVRRLIEEHGITACHTFAVRLVNDAMNKAETARKNSPAAGLQSGSAAAMTTSGS